MASDNGPSDDVSSAIVDDAEKRWDARQRQSEVTALMRSSSKGETAAGCYCLGYTDGALAMYASVKSAMTNAATQAGEALGRVDALEKENEALRRALMTGRRGQS